MVKDWYRLHREAVQPPSLEVFKIQFNKAVDNLTAESHSSPCFGLEVGQEMFQVSSNLSYLFCDSAILVDPNCPSDVLHCMLIANYLPEIVSWTKITVH